ncbi:lantibiotic dehydratase family protein [Flavobacterium sp.]|uniref:lantibiotic dehydratase family protein n=1 Tax=Flavobacterium sp. TaxID=239 RepID=UPI000EC621BE|nr:lantibiotic dehydratase family protein [Flavobacterium sp.]HCQ13428.1 hypothetical protein [Flavobacterium sp.]
MNRAAIKSFQNYVLRTPSFSISVYKELVDKYDFDKLVSIYNDKFLKEAITIASPDLVEALNKYSSDPKGFSIDKKESLEISLLKYLGRICSRCTPFGLFAGCSVGSFNNETYIALTTKEHFTRVTQFDMQFWSSLLHDLFKRNDVKPFLTYFQNSSLYSISEFYRYVEYKYVNKKREYAINAIRKSDYLEMLLEEVRKGLTIDRMVELLVSDPSENEDAFEFINELIDSQILVSNLESTITGFDELQRVLDIIYEIPTLKKESQIIEKIKNQLILLDETIRPVNDVNFEIKKLINELGVNYEDKYLFQIDMNTSTIVNTINYSVSKKVKHTITFLNSINKSQSSINQSNFIKSYEKRYESREMPLAQVLDSELGIGYLNNEMKDTNPILDKFSFYKKESENIIETWTNFDYLLQKKLYESTLNKSLHISISENDFPSFALDATSIPATFSVMIELIKNDNQEQIIFDTSGGMSAAKLLGRFCNINESILDLTNEIIEKEKVYYNDKILAEVVHIPEARTGNILRRPILREYEIPYLSNSDVNSDFKIDINDLMVSIQNNKIILRSRKLNKEIIPCLSNAHNYGKNSLPIYHFLCDLQSQGNKPIFSFSWGVLESHYSFFPRVYYKDVIVSKAKWKVKLDEIKEFYALNDYNLLNKFSIWKNNKNIPRYVNYVQHDNTLLLDLEREIGIKLFFKSVKTINKIILEEFLFTEDCIVKNTIDEGFTNQVIVSFYNEKAL